MTGNCVAVQIERYLIIDQVQNIDLCYYSTITAVIAGGGKED